MLEIIKKELNTKGVFSGALPPILTTIVDSIPNNKIPYRMKLTIAVSEFILFASHLRRNIAHWNGSIIPINAISFAIAESGSGKDSAVSAARKCFLSGYKLLDKKRKEIATKKAQQKAKLDGKENPNEWDTYKNYYEAPNPLFVSPSTSEGFIQHLNDLDSAGTGAGFIYTGEVGAELANSALLVDNIKLLAEMYDEGTKEVKVLKNRENQSKAIKNLPVSALLVGSQDNLLFDDSIKRVFKREFSTKLARRSFFMYAPEKVESPTFKSVEELLEYEVANEDRAIQSRIQVDEFVNDLAIEVLDAIGTPIQVSADVRETFILYQKYNEFTAETIKAQYPISKLVRTHLQWKALKLAGAIAIYDRAETINLEHYISAISFVEMLDKDMQMFESELVKEPYELFVDYMKSIADNGQATISLHVLRKMGYITTSGTPLTKIKELTYLANSYDNNGTYTHCDDGICYEELQTTEKVGVSFLAVSGTKEERQKACATGYDFYEDITFKDLAEMLAFDYAYSPFKFKDGKRSRDNIESGCKFVVLDVDKSDITDEEAHFLLSDINHHIARTSDPDNGFKFRVLIELDAAIDIPDIQWKHFMSAISDDLAIETDLLPKSQIFFSYADRKILSTLDANPLEVKPYILAAAEALSKKEAAKKPLTIAQKKQELDDPLTTFNYAYEASRGGRSRALIRAARHAQDLGADTQAIEKLMMDINHYWVEPLEETRFENTILSQIRRW